ncbi:hypothetical protein [Pseudobutyrivibrio sp.]|uniref:hypothetical protein n=1 Tax=Pseudobutyrivibrio sp. TaxID=2014367 RepID=UPI001D8B2F02|nr:hypothetical protein [Pseudobutyrivibrio sp.]MBE5911946.1 hypothetical protein [Pseudobutyrivibrio sp.]
MKLIHKTNTWKGHGKQNYYHNEYFEEGTKIIMYKINEFKSFDGKENKWNTVKNAVKFWDKSDINLPEWLKKKLK